MTFEAPLAPELAAFVASLDAGAEATPVDGG
jgi:hypothetical protein